MQFAHTLYILYVVVNQKGGILKRTIALLNRLHNEDVGPIDILLAACRDVSDKTTADKVSVWFFTPDHQALECACFYNTESDSFTSGQVLHAKDFPTYFETIEIEKYIVASDAKNLHATSELTKSCFRDNDIYSLLDFTIHDNKHPTGVICCEKINETYEWQDSDLYLLRQVSTLISHHIEQQSLTVKRPLIKAKAI